jgi:hypothetical protein
MKTIIAKITIQDVLIIGVLAIILATSVAALINA